MNHRYAVIGTGAIGGYYGARLRKAGADVHFLLRSDYAHVAVHGLVIDSCEGNFALPSVNAYREARQMPPCDVAAVALKTTRNHILPDVLPPVLGEQGIVLLLQNGLGEEEKVAAIPGVKTVVAGLCFICSTKVGPGHVHHQDYGYVRFAEYTRDTTAAGITAALQRIADDFTEAGIQSAIEEDLCLARWKKLIWNVPFSGLSVALNADTKQIVDHPASCGRAREIMEELVRTAGAYGRAIETVFVEKMIADTATMRPYFPSMKLDFDAGRQMELGSMYAAPLRAARLKGVVMPRVEELYRELSALEASRGTSKETSSV